MKFKAFLTMMVAGSLCAAAQGQGYMDGVEYYKAGQYDNALTILTNTLNNADTDKALANMQPSCSSLAIRPQAIMGDTDAGRCPAIF